jgi:hypothetical protein
MLMEVDQTRTEKSVLLVESKSESIQLHYRNTLLVPSFYRPVADETLCKDLGEYLKSFEPVKDVQSKIAFDLNFKDIIKDSRTSLI